MGRTIAIALHDIEPATFTRCALIRDWLYDHGVGRVTLLVIPARDLHPLSERCPDMVGWLDQCRSNGDAIAQHGFQHAQRRSAPWPQRLLHGRARMRGAEFVGLDQRETRSAVEAGWRLLRLAGIQPHGFVAPAYAYTPALHETLAVRFHWWAGLLQVHRPTPTPQRAAITPAWSLAGGGPVRGALSPALVRFGALTAGPTLRLDLHPSDLERPRHMLALESVLRRAHDRRAVTYDELVAAGSDRP
jgi:predicted deacetylase